MPTINIEDIVVAHQKFQPRMLWKMGIINIIKGSYGHTRRALVRITKSDSFSKRPVNLVYPIEYKDSMNVEQEEFNEQCNQRPAL